VLCLALPRRALPPHASPRPARPALPRHAMLRFAMPDQTSPRLPRRTPSCSALPRHAMPAAPNLAGPVMPIRVKPCLSRSCRALPRQTGPHHACHAYPRSAISRRILPAMPYQTPS